MGRPPHRAWLNVPVEGLTRGRGSAGNGDCLSRGNTATQIVYQNSALM